MIRSQIGALLLLPVPTTIARQSGFIDAAGGISGTFNNVSLLTLSDLSWHLRYNPNSVVLQVGITGDYNLNGAVDAADYVIWRKTLGKPASAWMPTATPTTRSTPTTSHLAR